MPNFVDNVTALPPAKTDRTPPTNPTQQWAAADANTTFDSLRDIRTVIRRDTSALLNVKKFGAVGDGITDDAAAINAALADAATTSNGGFGGLVYLPKGTYLCGSPLLLGNACGLIGDGPAATIVKASNTFNAAALIANATQDGTQEFAFLESLQVQGNKGGGAVCSVALVNFVSLFINSYIRDVVILESSSVNLRIAAVDGSGPVLVENCWLIHAGTHGLLVEEVAGNSDAFAGCCFINLTSEHQGSNSSAIYLKGIGSAAQMCFYNTHIEQGTPATNRTAITLDGVSHVLFQGIQLLADAATMAEGIKLTNVVGNVGIQINGLYNPNLVNPVIRDLKNSLTVGAINVPRFVTPDVNTRGGARFTPDTATAARSLVAQDSTGTDRAWFDKNGAITGSSLLGAAGVDVVGDLTNNRTVMFTPAPGSPFANLYGFFYPVGGGGVLRFRSFTAGADVFQVGTDGTMFFHQAPTFQGSATFQSAVAYSNEIVPIALSASTNNYNPTGLATAYAVLASATTPLSITGLAAPANGRLLWVYNLAANAITLTHEDAASTAANRFIGRGNANVVLTAATGVMLYYSTSQARWLVHSDTL